MNIKVVASPALPFNPSPAQDVVRMVRHGLADVLEWLGEDVGPKPGEATHALFCGSTLFVSQDMRDRLSG